MTFREFFQPTAEELSELWTNGLIVFDASVLLNVYGYSSDTSEKLIALLESLKEQVWIPHQFGLEYARERPSVVVKQASKYFEAERELKKIKEKYLMPKRDHPFLSAESMKGYDSICDELGRTAKSMQGLIGNDPKLTRILSVFEGRVGPAPTEDQLNKLHQDAKARFDNCVPPGYEDLSEKKPPDAYGDYVGWAQIMEFAKTQGRGVILVIDDFKPDWWLIEKERTVGPRPEIVAEFNSVVGKSFSMYTSENFLRAVNDHRKFNVDEKSIKEIAELLGFLRKVQQLHTAKPITAVKESVDNSADVANSSAASEMKPSSLDVLNLNTDAPKASKFEEL